MSPDIADGNSRRSFEDELREDTENADYYEKQFRELRTELAHTLNQMDEVLQRLHTFAQDQPLYDIETKRITKCREIMFPNEPGSSI